MWNRKVEGCGFGRRQCAYGALEVVAYLSSVKGRTENLAVVSGFINSICFSGAGNVDWVAGFCAVEWNLSKGKILR